MKANLFAAVLSLCVVSFPIQAASQANNLSTIKKEQSRAKINLNKADVHNLANSVKGIGQKRAQAIVKYREEHGAFKSIEELSQVRGLGKQFVKRNLAQLQAVFTID
ncbi:competence protein ComEA [Legionella lansingensis]|uniref:Competence protein ComEA n=1 Tax=Legionella lansingensis TaxID=45067 RepID=A0A0W0VPB6_9GAMM|nr:helix-hairpin-helix domain-containing protein [Legionella lansingensis]KTD21985.1 competence protein ComEA [Legionella lansingensis]SNV51611.1 competence protein ComEA [Legionella lansingensis]